MRFLIADYSGHPFQVQLSRELARRGHQVRHVYFAGFQTPKGKLQKTADDPAEFEIRALTLDEPFAKDRFRRRRRQEIQVGHLFADQIDDFHPDVVLSSNLPLDCQKKFQAAALRHGCRFLFWLQDIYSVAIARVVSRKAPVVGHAIGAFYRWLEFTMLRRSDGVVAITADFAPIIVANGVSPERIAVVENWAPLDELTPLPRDNPWGQANFRADGVRFVYSGTLGYKHDPRLMLELAQQVPDAEVVVFSEGTVARGLGEQAAELGVTNLSIRPWVDYHDLPAMLSAADVFLSVIEPEAGVYSVPSKILTYLAVGRPILAAIPPENLAARLVTDHNAGTVVAPGDHAGFIAGAARLAADPALRAQMGENGRNYALRNFDVTLIADKFVDLVRGLEPRHTVGEVVHEDRSRSWRRWFYWRPSGQAA